MSLNPEFNKSWENNEYLNVESTIKNGLKTIKEGLDTAYGDYAIPFTIEATQDGTTVYFRQSSFAIDDGLNPLKVDVSIDNGKTWIEVTAAPAGDDVPGAILVKLDKGEKVLICGENEAYGYYSSPDNADDICENCNFYADKPCYIYGNIMSLVGGEDFARLHEVKEYAFAYFFSDFNEELDWSWVLSKEGKELLLPATTLANSCYKYMFFGCTGLTIAPKLPATTLANKCYCYMFYSCTSLVSAPELPATTLTEGCYDAMFSGCTSLTVAPELPAITLISDCYMNIFSRCTSLSYIKAMFTTTPGVDTTYNWVDGVKATGTFVKNSAATWNVTGVNGVPADWTIETASK